MTKRIPIVARRLAGAAIAGCVTLAVAGGASTGSAGAAAATPTLAPVTLRGEGAWSVFEMTTGWHNALAAASPSVDYHYTAVGSYFGRQDFLNKGADWALSGVPFSDQELAAAKTKRSDLIDAPVVVASLGMLFQLPKPDGKAVGFDSFIMPCDPDDPSTWPPDITNPDDALVYCFNNGHDQPYNGPVKVPWQNLAAMLFGTGGPVGAWSNSDVAKAFGVANLASVPAGLGPGVALRSDPDETMYYMQDFISRFAPNVWTLLKSTYPEGHWDSVSEVAGHLTGGRVVSRGQADLQADLLTWGANNAPVDPATKGPAQGGVIAPVPSSIIKEPRDTWGPIFDPPSNFVQLLPILNKNGDWVTPTSASITKAAAAGLDTPLYAFRQPVAGAYPFTWIDHFYAPAHGLSIAKTEAMATLIRYLATAGQDVAASVGEGRLPAPLVQQSLKAADSLVQSNCVGADRRVVSSSDPGLYAPKIPALDNIGTMLHCEATGVPESTTTTTSSTTTPTFGSTPNDGNSSPFSDGSTSLDNGTGVGTATGSPTPGANGTADGTATGNGHDTGRPGAGTAATNKAVLATATHLPMQASGTTGVDKLGAFLLGAVLYLLLRKPAAQLVRRATG